MTAPRATTAAPGPWGRGGGRGGGTVCHGAAGMAHEPRNGGDWSTGGADVPPPPAAGRAGNGSVVGWACSAGTGSMKPIQQRRGGAAVRLASKGWASC